VAAPWKKLPPGWRIYDDWYREEDDDEESGGGGDDDGGGDDEGDGEDGGGDEGGGEGEGGEGGGGDGGSGEESGGDFGSGDFGGGDSGDSGDNGISWGGDHDSDGDGLDDNAVARSWAESRRDEERNFDADRGRDEYEREFERQQRDAEEADERQRQADEFQKQYQENQRLADAFRAQEVSQSLPQIGQPVPDQTSQLLSGLQQANQGSTTAPPGWSGLFAPPTEEAARPQAEPERPLERGAPPPAGGGGSLTAEQAAEWVARGINPVTGEPIERSPGQAPARPNPDTLFPPERGNPPAPQAPAQPNPDTLFPPERGNPPVPQAPARPNPDTLFPPDAPQAAATAAAAGAAAAGASPGQVAATAEQAARIVWDNQTLAQQTPWTRAAFRSEFGANAEAEWQRQHAAELGRNKTLYGVQEPMTGMAPRVGAPAGTPNAPNRRIGATPPPGLGEESAFGLPPRARSAPVAAAATGQAPRSVAPTVTAPGQTPAQAPATPPAPAPAAPTTAPGWTPVTGEEPPKPAVTLPKPQAPLAPPEPEAPVKPFTPWRPPVPGAPAAQTPGEAPSVEAPADISPTDLVPAEPQTGLTTEEIAARDAALNLDSVTGEAIYNDASTLPSTTTIKDPTQVQSVADLSIAARQSTMNRAYGPPVQVYIEPNGQMYSVGPDGTLRWEGKTRGDYERAQPIVTVTATDPVDPSGKPTRFTVQDWNKLSPEQQQQYQNVAAHAFTQPPNVVKEGPTPTRTDPALTAPGIIPRPGAGEPSGRAPTANDIMNGLIRGLPQQAPSGLSRQAMGASPVMVAGMSTEGDYEGVEPIPLSPRKPEGMSDNDWIRSQIQPIPLSPRKPEGMSDDDWFQANRQNLQTERGSSLPTASLPSSNVPSINPVTGEPTGLSHDNPDIARAAADPFGTIVDNAGRMQGAQDLAGFRASVAGGAVKGEAWAEPYMNDVARMAWYQETGGREGAPQDAPTQYINDWKNMWRAGQTDAPGIRELNQRMVQAGVAPPSGAVAPLGPPKYPLHAIVPNQYTDKEVQNIPGWQFDAACGITAGMGMARMIGLDPTAKDFLAAAKTKGGWTPGAGMGGTAGEVRMLESMGVPVVAQYNAKGEYIPEQATTQAVDTELAAGRPVILDTSGSPGHYFAIVGKTPQGYIVSGSGTALKVGSDVMTRQAMENAMGPWRNLVRLDTARLPQGAAQQQPAAAPAPPPASAKPTTLSNAGPSNGVWSDQVNEVALPDRMTTTSRADTLRQWAPVLEQAERQTGVPADQLAAIIIAENGGGQSHLSAQGNNWFSIQRSNQEGPYQTGDYANDPRWGVYKNPVDSLNHFLKLISMHQRYKGAWNNRQDPEKFVQGLIDGHYIVDEPNHPAAKWQREMADYRQQYRRAVGKP